jgi:PAS domain-containing protein
MNAPSCFYPNQPSEFDLEPILSPEPLLPPDPLLQKLAVATAGILYIYDMERNCNCYVNRDIGIFLGYERGEIDSLAPGLIDRLMHPDDLARVPAHLEKCRELPDGAAIGFEYRAKTAAGTWQWIYTQKTVFSRDPAGLPQQLLGTTVDMTSHKLVEAELEQRVSQRTADLIQLNHQLTAEILQHQKTKEQLHTVLDAVPGMISWLDDDLHYLGVNQQLADRCQLPPEAFVGRQLGFLNPKGDQFTEFAQRFFQSHKPSDRQEVDRNQFTFLTIAQKYNHNKAAVFIQIDITDRKAIEALLEQANGQLATANTELAHTTEQKDQMLLNMSNLYAELARATRLKDEFLANMSHELRTPLNAILGMSEGLLDRLCGEITDRQQRAISAIEQSGKHLLDLINEILDLAKIESGNLDLNPAPVKIQHLFKQSIPVCS